MSRRPGPAQAPFNKKYQKTIDNAKTKVYTNCIITNSTVGTDDMIEINPTSSQPIFEQIIAQIKMAVLKGLLKPGDSIPSVRKMALSLSVTPGTVAKAYGELERQQVIVTIRGKGAYIAETGKIQPSERQKEQGRQKLKEACVEMIYLGFSKKEILKMVEELYNAATS